MIGGKYNGLWEFVIPDDEMNKFRIQEIHHENGFTETKYCYQKDEIVDMSFCD